MRTESLINTARTPVRPPPLLVPIISASLKRVKQNVVEIGTTMLEARRQMSHAKFLRWSKENFNLKRTQSLDYLEIGKNATTSEQNNNNTTVNASGAPDQPTSVRGHQRNQKKKKKSTRSEDRKGGNGQAYTATSSTSSSQQEYQIGLDLIEAGFRTLAKTMHPDKGGSQAAMATLNKVRSRLKTLWR